MFCLKGENPEKEAIELILSSVGMKPSSEGCSFLILLNRYGSLPRDLSQVKTINRLTGHSKEVLTEKYTFMEMLVNIKSKAALPVLLFKTIYEPSLVKFINRGTKYKFLKASDGFAGSGNKVVDSVKEVQEFVKSYTPTKAFKGWILQDALETTATFKGYKFHIRVIVVVVVQNGKTSIYCSNYHTYVLSNKPYEVGRLKEPEIYDTHKKRNTHNAFFPMERPDGWTEEETRAGMKNITNELHSIFNLQHSFIPDWKIKNGYELLGVDILFDTKHNPYILEINQKMAFYPSQTVFLPEILHLGLGGPPVELFKPLYGSASYEKTPLEKPLTLFYNSYTSSIKVQKVFQTLFHIKLKEDGDRAYYLYKKPIIKNRTIRTKSKRTGSKTLKRGSTKSEYNPTKPETKLLSYTE